MKPRINKTELTKQGATVYWSDGATVTFDPRDWSCLDVARPGAASGFNERELNRRVAVSRASAHLSLTIR